MSRNEARPERSDPGFRRARLTVLFSLALGLACSAPRSDRVTVSGKTVLDAMGVEEVTVRAFPAEGDGEQPVAETRSGYHGSFALRLAPGAYRLVATGSLPSGPGTRALRGETRVRVGSGRVDRVVIVLEETGP